MWRDLRPLRILLLSLFGCAGLVEALFSHKAAHLVLSNVLAATIIALSIAGQLFVVSRLQRISITHLIVGTAILVDVFLIHWSLHLSDNPETRGLVLFPLFACQVVAAGAIGAVVSLPKRRR